MACLTCPHPLVFRNQLVSGALYSSHSLDLVTDSTIATGQLLKGATDDNGNQKAAALLVGIKLDLEAEVHLTARVRGDICIGLY